MSHRLSSFIIVYFVITFRDLGDVTVKTVDNNVLIKPHDITVLPPVLTRPEGNVPIITAPAAL